jgi:hypothetical protein
MKKQLHEWEADIRQKVNQHDFGYEAGAWADMEQLLDQAGLPPAQGKAAGGEGLWLKLGISLTVALSVIILVAWPAQDRSPDEPYELSSFSIPAQTTPTVPPLPEQERVPVIQQLPRKEIQMDAAKRYYPLPENTEPLMEAPVEMEIPPLLPRKNIQLPPAPQKWDATDYQLPPSRPKRDRKKLFPDIIERNK